MKITSLLFFMLVVLHSYKANAQNHTEYNNINTDEKFVYVSTTKTYERIAEKGYKSVDLFQKLGNSFYANMDMEKAAKWYGELFALTKNLDPIYYNQYAKSLSSIGEDEKAYGIVMLLNKRLKVKKTVAYSKYKRKKKY